MSTLSIIIIAVLAAAAVSFALAYGRARRSCESVEKTLGRAMHDLRHLERTFALFAPAGVVDRLTAQADAVITAIGD